MNNGGTSFGTHYRTGIDILPKELDVQVTTTIEQEVTLDYQAISTYINRIDNQDTKNDLIQWLNKVAQINNQASKEQKMRKIINVAKTRGKLQSFTIKVPGMKLIPLSEAKKRTDYQKIVDELNANGDTILNESDDKDNDGAITAIDKLHQ